MGQTSNRTIKKTGIDQGDLFELLTEILALVNELRTDHETTRDLLDELVTDHATFITLTSELKSDFDAHTHNADGSQVGSYFTSIPKTDAATLSGGTTRSIAAADVGALTNSNVSELTAPAVSMSGH